jgi:hypothetical protein
VASVLSAARQRLPAPVADSLQRWRGRLAYLIAGVQFNELRVDAARAAERARDEALVALRTAVNDLLVRQDTILASYDRRVAALANKVLDLEEAVGRGGLDARGDDTNRIVSEHSGDASPNGA